MQSDEKNGGKISEGSNDDNECDFKSRFRQKYTIFTISTQFSMRNSKITVSRASDNVYRIFWENLHTCLRVGPKAQQISLLGQESHMDLQ